MGNHHPKLNAAEGGSIFDSFKSKLATNEPQVVTGTTETGDASQASTSELQSSTRVAESPEDPNRIESTLTPFPGTWNDLHKIKEIFPKPFDGVKATFNKGLSRYFQVNHSFTLGTMQPSNYTFGATYIGSKQLSQSESFPVMLGEIDPSGNLSAQCVHAFTRNTRSRLVAQHQGGSFQAIELGTDYRGSKTTASVTIANPDLLAGTGIFVAHYLQAITRRLALGAELLLHRGMNPQLGRMSKQTSNSFAAIYAADNWSAAVQVSPMELGLHTSYLHKLNPQQSVGVELDGKVATGECVATLGYCFEIPAAETTVKAQIDTNFNIATTVEKRMSPLPMSLTLSCQGNQKKAQYVCGIGLTVGG